MELWSHPSLIYRFPDSLCSYNLHQFTSISHDFAESPTNLKTCWMAEKSIRCRLQLSTCLERPKSAGYPGLVAINHEIILIFCLWEAPSLFVSTHIKHHLTWLHKWIPNNNSPNYISQNISPQKKGRESTHPPQIQESSHGAMTALALCCRWPPLTGPVQVRSSHRLWAEGPKGLYLVIRCY